MLASRMLAVRALALLTALLVAWPAAAASGYQLTCRMMGGVVKKCCCAPGPGHGATGSSLVEVRPRSCCEVSPAGDHEAVPGVRHSELRLEVPFATAALPLFEVPERSGRSIEAGPFLARAPPVRTVPLFLTNCSFLS
jgi:hypothetical protein